LICFALQEHEESQLSHQAICDQLSGIAFKFAQLSFISSTLTPPPIPWISQACEVKDEKPTSPFDVNKGECDHKIAVQLQLMAIY